MHALKDQVKDNTNSKVQTRVRRKPTWKMIWTNFRFSSKVREGYTENVVSWFRDVQTRITSKSTFSLLSSTASELAITWEKASMIQNLSRVSVVKVWHLWCSPVLPRVNRQERRHDFEPSNPLNRRGCTDLRSLGEGSSVITANHLEALVRFYLQGFSQLQKTTTFPTTQPS
jgi:hypothetical protein